MEKFCNECREPAARVRKGRCDACYMRLYRRGAPVRGDRCAACGERRLPALLAEHGRTLTPRELVALIYAEVEAWAPQLNDDVVILALRPQP